MKIRIGENIKRLRKSKNLTQEQLSELMNVSCAAVSKWESSDTYPDVTLIFPLANLFGVSVDDLMGYDSERIEKEINDVLVEYRQLKYEGKYKESGICISKAHREYPNDYRIMNCYMWDIAGGSAENDSSLLKSRSNELLRICDCILEGCTDESLRLESMTMKAKLLHASGDKQSTLSVLAEFPSWYQSSGQKTEQLFAKDTSDFRYWVRRNLYELADFCADKAVKTIFFDPSTDLSEKVIRSEHIGDSIANCYHDAGETFLCLMAKSIYGRLANDLTFRDGKADDIIRIRYKNLSFVKKVTELSVKDAVLLDLIKYEHNTDNLLEWTINYYLTTNDAVLAKLRESKTYIEMLNKFKA